MGDSISERTASIIRGYTADNRRSTAQVLRAQWLEHEPNRSMEGVKAEQREQYEAVGMPVPVLRAIGLAIAKPARRDVSGFIPLAELLWDEYGREGRVVALIVLGAMELVEPERVIALLRALCTRCVSWEDADRLAMDALEPAVRKDPDRWLGELAVWLEDGSKWVRRAAVTVIGRLPMRHPARTEQCLEFVDRLLLDPDADVRRAISFAIRVCAKADSGLVCAYLRQRVHSSGSGAVWVLSDVVRSMDRRIVGDFASLMPCYVAWRDAPGRNSRDLASIDSAVRVLRGS